jgi:ABC-2 type transport system ATP-binding protein
MRLILGLDAPNSGHTVVNGKPYRDHAAPLHEVGALLDARSVHTGRRPPTTCRRWRRRTGSGVHE